MVVRTQTPEVLKNRRSVLEFLLLNHPLDCPVCDQAGECELQNYYMQHGAYDARFNENKHKRKKAYPIGKHVILDQERCILCTRCVRFTQEISKTAELAVHDRGHVSVIDLFPGVELNNQYSGNVVDVCPVGALTDRDFRFQCRVWFLGTGPSVCPGCSRGCNISIHYNQRYNERYHERRVQRLKPRFNQDVNGHWMCDEGRYAFHLIDAPNRLRRPAVRENGEFAQTSWDAALEKVARELQQTIAAHGAGAVGVLASAQMTNEELFRVRQLFGDFLKLENLEFHAPPREPVYADDFLVTPDKNPNSRGAELLGLGKAGVQRVLEACAQGRIRFLYIFGHDLLRAFDAQYLKSALGKTPFIVFQGSWNHPTAAAAHVQLPSAVYAERDGTFVNVQGRVQRIQAAVPPSGEALPDLEILRRLAKLLGAPQQQGEASEVFREIAQQVGDFAGMSYETVGLSGQLLKNIQNPSESV
jgi:NADH-quinone oxidoreductase subunit G